MTNATTHCSHPFQLFYERADFALRGSGISAVTLETVALSSSGLTPEKRLSSQAGPDNIIVTAGSMRTHRRRANPCTNTLGLGNCTFLTANISKVELNIYAVERADCERVF